MTRKTLVSILTVAAVTGIYGFMSPTLITSKGSDTMVILAQRWAEVYQAKHPEVSIQVTGGGSGTGISALINGTTDICNSSRPMKPAERDKLKQRFGSAGVEVRVAKDGITIYTNPKNPVKTLTLEQLRNIYTGRFTNWNQVGGANARIILYGRENSSGTYSFFKEHVLQNLDFAASTQTLPGTAAIVNAITKDPNGIGYGGFGYAKGIHIVLVSPKTGSPGLAPSEATIKSGQYPISRFLYIYLRNRPTGALKSYIDWILSDDGQSVVKKTGYFSVK